MNNIDDKHFGWLIRGFYSSVFAGILLWFILGILAAYWLADIPNRAGYSAATVPIWAVAVAVSAFFVLIYSVFRRQSVWGLRLWVDVLWFALGGFALSSYSLPVTLADSSPQKYVVGIASNPLYRNGYYRADATILSVVGDSVANGAEASPVGAKVLLNFKADSGVVCPSLFDKYVISARLSLPQPDGNPYSFDYGEYLLRHGYSGVGYLYRPYFAFLDKGAPTGISGCLEWLRGYLLQCYKRVGIDGDELSIVSAITLGEKGMLSAAQKADFAAAGVQHILVVSGMHVGFLYMFVIFLVRRVRRKRLRPVAVAGGLAVLWLYALLTGLAPAVLRATVMFTIMLLFYVFGQQYRTYHALFLAALVTLVANPYTLFDVGFQLSYLAVMSIAYFYPKISRLWSSMGVRHRLVDIVWQPVAVTVSAQILTFPIVLYAFYQFPVYFVVTNIVASFVTPIIFCGGMVAIVFSFVPYIGQCIGAVLDWLVYCFDWVVASIAGFQGAVARGFITPVEVVFVYLIVLAVLNLGVMWQRYQYRFSALVIVLATVAVLATVDIFLYTNRIDNEGLVVLNRQRLCVDRYSHSGAVVYANEADTAYLKESLLPLHLSVAARQTQFVTDTALSANCFAYKGETFLILRDNVFRYRYNKGNPLAVDCLVIDRGVYPSAKLFDKFISPKRVVLTAAVWDGYIGLYTKLLDERGIEYYSPTDW